MQHEYRSRPCNSNRSRSSCNSPRPSARFDHRTCRLRSSCSFLLRFEKLDCHIYRIHMRLESLSSQYSNIRSRSSCNSTRPSARFDRHTFRLRKPREYRSRPCNSIRSRSSCNSTRPSARFDRHTCRLRKRGSMKRSSCPSRPLCTIRLHMAAIPSLYTRLKSRYVFICESVSKQVIKGMFVLTDAAALATRLPGLIAILA